MNNIWMGALAAQDQYNPEEGHFQTGIRATPWFSEFKQKYGEEPNLNDPDYDYRAAWRAGARPDVRDPGDSLLHWPSQFKGENHPNRFVDGVDTRGGDDVGVYRGMPRLDPGLRRAPGDTAMRPAAETFGQVVGDLVIPQDPLDYAAMFALGPAGKMVGKGVRAGALAMGGVLGLSDEAEAAGKLRLVKKIGETFTDPKLRAKAETLHGKYPQYAEDYPEVGQPALLRKLESGKAGPEVPYKTMEEALAKDATPKYFLSKKLLPDVEQFQKDRGIIQKEMDLHGYAPYFDPAKRFDVDPKHYGPFADTGTAAAPATAKTDAEWLAKYGTPENRAKLQAGFEKGKAVPGSENWYFMGQLEREYIKELGPKAGREAFKREFGDMMAATTGGAAPYDNFLMAQYANVMAKRGERLPERSYNLPFPIGGRYASGNIAQAQKYIDAGQVGFDPAVNPKRYDFSSAFAGNPNAMTIDEQMYGALRPTTTKPSVGLPEWYGPATRVAREEAAKVGVEPRSFQDVTWAGLKAGKTEAGGKAFDYEGPMINHLNRSIETTHRLTGMPREEVVRRGLIRKEIPMYGVAGATMMGALAAQDEYR